MNTPLRSLAALVLASAFMFPFANRACAQAAVFNADVRAVGTLPSANAQGPLAAANAVAPSISPGATSSAALQVDARGQWKALHLDAWLSGAANERGGTSGEARFNELYADVDSAGWQWSAGKKIVGWDVGYGFRPNDVVAQEPRRLLLPTTSEGRTVLQAERFGAEDAWTLVWVQPDHMGRAADRQRGADESALAARGYWRRGALDVHAFAREGEHTGPSVGAALAWVATNSLELHASARLLKRHDGWTSTGGPGNGLLTTNPWSQQTLGKASQWLIGLNWTGESQVSVLAEAWHDGTAPGRAQWREWTLRNAGLASSGFGEAGSRQGAVAGNLTWQAAPLSAASLQQDNLFVRLAWQPGGWTWSLDALYHPADHGHVWTAAVQWQGDRWRVNAAWRKQGGPSDSVLAQLPVRQQLVVALTRSF